MTTKKQLKVFWREIEEKQQKIRVFLDVIFAVNTHVDNRERARASD